MRKFLLAICVIFGFVVASSLTVASSLAQCEWAVCHGLNPWYNRSTYLPAVDQFKSELAIICGSGNAPCRALKGTYVLYKITSFFPYTVVPVYTTSFANKTANCNDAAHFDVAIHDFVADYGNGYYMWQYALSDQQYGWSCASLGGYITVP